MALLAPKLGESHETTSMYGTQDTIVPVSTNIECLLTASPPFFDWPIKIYETSVKTGISVAKPESKREPFSSSKTIKVVKMPPVRK